jgi:CYTH domain-containing protein
MRKKKVIEIERKFAMENYPDLPHFEESELRQGYINLDPEIRFRWRKMPDGTEDFKLTIKSNGDLTRQEIEVPLSHNAFYEIGELIGKTLVLKLQRKYLLSDGNVLEVNFVDPGLHTKFMYAEIEFKSEEEALNFQKPNFLGEELTYDSSYKMKNFWKRTRLTA